MFTQILSLPYEKKKKIYVILNETQIYKPRSIQLKKKVTKVNN